MRVEGAAKSLIYMTPFMTEQATNQGVVGSIPASRTRKNQRVSSHIGLTRLTL